MYKNKKNLSKYKYTSKSLPLSSYSHRTCNVEKWLTIRAQLLLLSLWVTPQEVLQGRPIAAQRIVGRHKPATWATFKHWSETGALRLHQNLPSARRSRKVLEQKWIELTCCWQRSTWAAAPRWSASTPAPSPGGRGTCRWTRRCRLTHRPAWRWTSRRCRPHVCRRRAATAWRPGSSSSLGPSGCADLRRRTVKFLHEKVKPAANPFNLKSCYQTKHNASNKSNNKCLKLFLDSGSFSVK